MKQFIFAVLKTELDQDNIEDYGCHYHYKYSCSRYNIICSNLSFESPKLSHLKLPSSVVSLQRDPGVPP